jgi:hypothetical protein
MKKKTAEEYYENFKKMGFDHQEARVLALKAVEFNEKVSSKNSLNNKVILK